LYYIHQLITSSFLGAVSGGGGINNIPITMSAAEDKDKEADDMMMCCASCGKAEADNVTMSKYCACKSVQYCCVECQEDHMPQHEDAYKKRAVKIRDEILFKRPESNHLGDFPICLFPLVLD
jgi:hypothetical protein